MTGLTEQLIDLATEGASAIWAQLDLQAVTDQASEIAAGPLAPILAHALAAAANGSPAGWESASANFVVGLPDQKSLLALASSIEELLASPATVHAQGARLHDALLHDLTSVIQTSPLLAASRLEGAVRLALADAVPPFTVLGQLTSAHDQAPEEFTERLPRLLGAAMDRWANESTVTRALRQALDRLRHDEAAAIDATFELACDQLRAALSAETLPAAIEALAAARTRFATVDAAEEARHDARAYAAACDAVLAFGAQDLAGLTDAASRLDAALDQREAWLCGMHEAPWLRPRLAAELAWRRLVLVLHAAAEKLSLPVWLNAWEALAAVLDAYRQARTMRPLSDGSDTQGLAAVIEPAVEGAILRQQSLFAALHRSIAEAGRRESPPLDITTAELLLARINAAAYGRRDRQSRSSLGSTGEGDDEEPHQSDPMRLLLLAPALVHTLGQQQVSALAANLDDEMLRIVEGIAYSAELARSRTAHPVLDPLLEHLTRQLAESPGFVGDVRNTFILLLEQTLRFLMSRADLTTKTWGLHKGKDKDYRRLLRKGEKKPIEADLQQDYYQWLATGQLGGLVNVEVSDIATGRADVLVSFGTLRYLTEIKRELSEWSQSTLEVKYIQQAAEYGNTNVAFGQLLVLDLTPHPTGALRFDESTWIARHKPAGGRVERSVAVGVVAGNRSTPSGLSW